MKFVKLGLISVVVLGGIITIFSLFLPSQVIISRAIDIAAPKDTVVALVTHPYNWQLWMHNPDSVEVSVTAGAVPRVTMGAVTITLTSIANKTVQASWQYKNNRPLPGQFSFFGGDGTQPVTVQWQFIQQVKWYPWEKFASIVSDKALGPTMEQSLDNLKNVATGQPLVVLPQVQ